MILYLFLAILAIISVYQYSSCNKSNIWEPSYRKSRRDDLLFYSSFIVFFVLAFQYNVGSDTEAYSLSFFNYKFLKLSDLSLFQGYSLVRVTEPGWCLLNNFLVNTIGNFWSVTVLEGILISYVYYKIIKYSSNKEFLWISALLFFLDSNGMSILFSAMRQAYAIGFLVLSIMSLSKNKYIQSILLAFIAFTFHRTSIICWIIAVLLYLILVYAKKSTLKLILWGLFTIEVIGFAFAQFLFERIDIFSANYLSDFSYLGYVNELVENDRIVGLSTYIIGLFKILISYFIIKIISSHDKLLKNDAYTLLLSITYFCLSSVLVAGSSYRFALYFHFFAILSYAYTFAYIKKKHRVMKSLMYVFLIFVALLNIRSNMTADKLTSSSYAFYETIFFK